MESGKLSSNFPFHLLHTNGCDDNSCRVFVVGYLSNWLHHLDRWLINARTHEIRRNARALERESERECERDALVS